MSNVAVITARIIVINLLLFDTFSTITAFQHTQTVLLTSLNLFSSITINNNNKNNNTITYKIKIRTEIQVHQL